MVNASRREFGESWEPAWSRYVRPVARCQRDVLIKRCKGKMVVSVRGTYRSTAETPAPESRLSV